MKNVRTERSNELHPKEKGNFLSHLFFLWQVPILFKGYRKQFTESDLHNPLKEHQSKFLGDKLEKVWLEEVRISGTDASLWKVLAKVFGLELALYGLLLIPIEVVLRMSEPFLIWKMVHYYTTDHKTSKDEVYIYVALLITELCLKFICLHNFWFGMEHIGAKIRIACTSLIYRKCLRLSQETLNKLTAGQIINLVATDVTKFNNGLIRYVHYIWLVPILAAIVLYSLYSILDGTAIIGAVVLLLFIPVQIMLSKKMSKSRLKMSEETDQRVRLLHEVIEGIKVVKVMCWEKAFIKLTENYRQFEMRQLKLSLRPVAINAASTLFFSRIAIFISILAYILTGHSLHAEYIFLLVAFYEIIKITAGVFGPWSLTFVGDIISSVKRIESFLKNAENNEKEKGVYDGIVVENVTTKKNILNGLSLTIQPRRLTAVIGPVGCGKSTVLKAILNEVPLLEGSIQTGGTISYASQEAWIFDGTVRENILFGEDHDEDKYERVIKVCCLERDFSLLPYSDSTLVGSKGAMLSGGQKSRINLARAIYKDTDCYLLDDPLSAVDAQVGKFIFNNCLKTFLKNKTILLVTHQLQYLDQVDFIYIIEKGKNLESGTFEDLKRNPHFKMMQIRKSAEHKKEEKCKREERKGTNNTKAVEVAEIVKTGVVSSDVYKSYLRASGWGIVVVALFLQIVAQFFASGTDFFLTVWVNFEQKNKNADVRYFLYIYISIIVILIPVSLISIFIIVKCCTNASKNLHKKILNNVLNTSMTFFNTNTSGRILNRFSSDIGQIDRNLPLIVVHVALILSNFFAIVILVSIVNYWVVLPTSIIMVLFLYARKIYLTTSRILKRVEAKSRSPVYSHLSTTIQGLATIRVLQAVEDQRRIFEKHLDKHTAANYMFLACDSAFGFWLDFCSFTYFVTVILGFVFTKSEVYGGNVGLTLTSSILFVGMLQYGMKQYTELENQMVSVERVLEYTEIDKELSGGAKLTSKWPSKGHVEFRDVSLRYNPDVPLVLKQLTFTISANDKIGIVGRTGSGKSSLVSILFRLFEFGGDITIDGVNTKTIPLHTLRSKISIIPQEPVLFSCSIRKNLDPFDEYQDSSLWNALDDVEIRKVISSFPAGLSTKLIEGGSNLSVGEKQLLCLARAILKMNKIIILDEATANVDLKTEDLIRSTIKRRFKTCTVLTIAHRIHTVMDCDKVLVMGDGCVLEYDSPSKLLQNVNGVFYGLVHLENSDDM